MIEFKLLLLVIVANATPLAGSLIFGRHLARPLDFGLILPDGERLFGAHTTLRGVVLALLATAITAHLLSLPAEDGLIIGLGAMAGDAISSLVKRRLGIRPGGMAPGLDQLPESLLPLCMVASDYALSLPTILTLGLAFMVFDLLASRLLCRLGLKGHPH